MPALNHALLLLPLVCLADPAPPLYAYGQEGAQLTAPDAEQRVIDGLEQRAPQLPLDAPLRLLAAPMPPYDARLRSMGRAGKVTVRMLVEADGSVSQAVLVNAASSTLAQPVLDTLLRWRFAPITTQGKPARHWVEQTFDFRLSD